MPEFRYGRGRIEESLQFLTEEKQAIKMFKDKHDVVLKLIQAVLEREKKKRPGTDKLVN